MSFSRFNPGCCCDEDCELFISAMGLASTARPVEAYRIWKSTGSVERRLQRNVYYTGNSPRPDDDGEYSDELVGSYDLSGGGVDTESLIMADWHPSNGAKYYEDTILNTTPRTDGQDGVRNEYLRYYWVFQDHDYESGIVFKYEKGSQWPSQASNFFNGILGNNGSGGTARSTYFPDIDGLNDLDLLGAGDLKRTNMYYMATAPDETFFDQSNVAGAISHEIDLKAGFSSTTAYFNEWILGSESEFWVVNLGVFEGTVGSIGYKVNRYDAVCTSVDDANGSGAQSIQSGDPTYRYWNGAFPDLYGYSPEVITTINLPTSEEYTHNAQDGTYTSTKKVFDGLYLHPYPMSNLTDSLAVWRDGDVLEYGYKDATGETLFNVKISIERLPSKYQLPLDVDAANFTAVSTGKPIEDAFGNPWTGTTPTSWYWSQVDQEYTNIQDAGAPWISSKVIYDINGEVYTAYFPWSIQAPLFPEFEDKNEFLIAPPFIDLVYRDGSIFTYLKGANSAALYSSPESFLTELDAAYITFSEMQWKGGDDLGKGKTLNKRFTDIDLTDAHWYVKPGNSYTTMAYLKVQNVPDDVGCNPAIYDGMEYPYSVPEISITSVTPPQDCAPMLEADTGSNHPGTSYWSLFTTPFYSDSYKNGYPRPSTRVRSEPVTVPWGYTRGSLASDYNLEARISKKLERSYPELISPFVNYGPYGFDRRIWDVDESASESIRVINQAGPSGVFAWDTMPWDVSVTREVVDQTEDTITLDVTTSIAVWYQPVGVQKVDTRWVAFPSIWTAAGSTQTSQPGIDPAFHQFADEPVDPVPLDQFTDWPPTVPDPNIPGSVLEFPPYYAGWEREGYLGSAVYAVYETPGDMSPVETTVNDSSVKDYFDPDQELQPESYKHQIYSTIQRFRAEETIRVVVTKGSSELLRFKPAKPWANADPVGNLIEAKPAILEAGTPYYHYVEVSKEGGYQKATLEVSDPVINQEEDQANGLGSPYVATTLLAHPELVYPPSGGVPVLSGVEYDNQGESDYYQDYNYYVDFRYADFTDFTVEVTIDGDW